MELNCWIGRWLWWNRSKRCRLSSPCMRRWPRSMSRLVISARRSGISNATSRSRNGFLTSRLITAKKHSMPCSSWIERGWKRKISGTGMKRSNGSLSTMKAWSLNWKSLVTELDSYAANVAHDLKNPIGVILGFSTLLEMELDSIMDEKQRDSLRLLIATTEKMQAIVESLLSLAQAHRAEVMPQPVVIQEVVENALNRLELDILGKGATVQIDGPLPPALADPSWLEEAWVNYISNALKYGGEPPQIRIDAVPTPDSD